MTRSFGGPGGGQGGRPGGRGGRPAGRPGGTGGQRWDEAPGQPQSQLPQAPDPTVPAVRPEFGKRTVALVVDFAACYFGGAIISMIPFVSAFLPTQMTMLLLLLTRDYYFDGRGVGKNIMGLQVIDSATGRGCSLFQSVMRNIVLLAPFVVLQVIGIVLRFVPIPWINEAVVNIVNLVGMIYTAVVVPLEAYRVWSNPAGSRFGDDIAGTAIVEAPMDFSRPLPR